jgi:hypothetical protein
MGEGRGGVTGPGSRNLVSAWRDALAALRETAIVLLILAFVLFPRALGGRLQALGVGNIEFAGVKIDVASVVKAKAAVQGIAGQLRRADVVPGRRLTTAGDVYLRDASQPLEHAQAPVLGVLGRGDTVQIVARDSSSARTGGWFLWAKVRRP